MPKRPLLVALEEDGAGGADLRAPLAYVAAQAIELNEGEVRATVRRALFVLAAGGDPTRELSPDDRAVSSLAAELETAGRHERLAAELGTLHVEARGLPNVEAALASLLADPATAWRWLAVALLADELGSEGDG